MNHVKKPDWLKINIGANARYTETKHIVDSHKLHTICSSGRCPNMGECWGKGTATFMIGGEICTRSCKFCNTQTGRPLPLDPEELNRIYEQLEELPDYLLDDLESFISCYGSLEELVEHKDDIILYSGCETMTDLAYYLIDEEQVLGEIPSSLQTSIDYEAYGRDLDIEGTFIATNAGICEVLR